MFHTSLPHSPTRVLFVLGSFGGGGAERQTLAWLRHLDRTRFAPVLYVISRDGPLLGECPTDVPVFAYGDRAGMSRLYIPGRAYRRQIRDLQRVVDEVRPGRIISVSLLMTLLAAGLPSVPAGWFAVEMADPRCDFRDQIRRFREIKRRRLRDAYHRATPVAVSAGVREGLAEFYNIPIGRIEVVPNAIDGEAVQRQADQPGPELETNCFHVANVGRLQPQKGQLELLEAVRRLVRERGLDSLRLHVLGEGPCREELEAFIERHELRPHVVLHGYHANPPAFVARCDLFCLASVYEGLPLALLEAMVCGTPVVSTDCPSGPREVLADGRYGRLVAVGDPAGLADAIEEAINDPAVARSRAFAAQRYVKGKYLIPIAMERWRRLLE